LIYSLKDTFLGDQIHSLQDISNGAFSYWVFRVVFLKLLTLSSWSKSSSAAESHKSRPERYQSCGRFLTAFAKWQHAFPPTSQ